MLRKNHGNATSSNPFCFQVLKRAISFGMVISNRTPSPGSPFPVIVMPVIARFSREDGARTMCVSQIRYRQKELLSFIIKTPLDPASNQAQLPVIPVTWPATPWSCDSAIFRTISFCYGEMLSLSAIPIRCVPKNCLPWGVWI